MSDTNLFFQELDNAEKNAAISLSINGNVQSEIIERDLTILLLKTEIKSLRDRNEVLDGAWSTVNAHREQLTTEVNRLTRLLVDIKGIAEYRLLETRTDMQRIIEKTCVALGANHVQGS